MKKRYWAVTFFNGDGGRRFEHFEFDPSQYGLAQPNKRMIEDSIGEEIHNNWAVTELKDYKNETG